MECKYIKYTIIELVPYELKSRKTPLYTILNIILLWSWLFIYLIYIFLSKIVNINKKSSFFDFFSFFKSKYNHTKPANEVVKTINKEKTNCESLDTCIMNECDDSTYIINIETTEFNSKHSLKILKKILEKEDLNISNFDRDKIREIGKFILRKDIVTVNISEKNSRICNKTLLVRSISDPVNMYMKFMLKKIF